MRDLLPILEQWAADGRRAALCTVVAVHGRAPLPLGSSLIVADDGATAGAVSGGCVERDVIEVAHQVMHGAVARRLRFAPGDHGLTGAGLPCGGGIDVWVQPWGTGPEAAAQAAFAADARAEHGASWTFDVAPLDLGVALSEPTVGVGTSGGRFALQVEPLGRLVLVGAGPVAGALAALAGSIGLRPVVVDPRPAVAAQAPTEDASELLLSWPAEALGRLAPLGPADAVLALSHQPAIDDAALLAAVTSEAGFVGALGSRQAHAARLDRLRDRGLGEASLARIVGPVGLDLGGWAPGEVALSIAAEVVAARHGRAGGRLAEGHGALHAPYELTPTGEVQRAPGTRVPPRFTRSAQVDSPITGVVLAAGAGRRFGGAKQAAKWQGEALVARAMRAAAEGLPPGSDLIVVVGAHERAVRAALPPDIPHRVVVASEWAQGMGASLQAGLVEVQTHSALVLLADQPLVDGTLVDEVLREGYPAITRGAAAARPVVGGSPGHPVLLGPIALTRAAELAGDQGLRPLLEPLYVHEVPVDGLACITDIDQPADLLRTGRDPAWT